MNPRSPPGRVWRFLLAGLVNTLFGWLIYACLILIGTAPWFALIVGTILGVGFNFFTIGGFVFRNRVKERIPRFVFAYGCIYVFNLICLELFKSLIPSDIWRQLALALPIAAASYLLQSRYVFVKRECSRG
jgi:putative flippase GtrA